MSRRVDVAAIYAGATGRVELVCREWFSDGHCARPARFLVGSGALDGVGYAACERCAEFWASDCRVPLADVAPETLVWLVRRDRAEPIEGPSQEVKRTPAHRRAQARERGKAA